MDWPESTAPLIIAFPRGRQRDGGTLAGTDVVGDNPLRWTSRYATLVTSVYGLGGIDGFNEQGLAAHGLYLKATDFGPRDVTKPGVHAGLWVQYLLDQAGTVAEALSLTRDIDIVMVSARGHDATLHVALEDSTGDSAVVEFNEGKLVIHHGPEYTLMTNDPTYEEQLKLLSLQDFSHPDLNLPLPGNVNAVDRFQRAAYYSALLPKPEDERQSVACVMAIMRNVSVPFGAPYGEFGVYNTEYRTVCDLTNQLYFFELTTSPNVIWVNFDVLPLVDGGEALAVDPYDDTMVGDVTGRFAPRQVGF
jgi:choloylglycine hydrolase